MRIAITTPLYAIGIDGTGGVGNSASLLTKHLVARGHDVDVFTVGTSRLAFGNKIEVFEKSVFELASKPEDAWVWDAAGALKIGKMLSARPYDIIHNNCISYVAFLDIAPRRNCLTTIRVPADWSGWSAAFPSVQIACEIEPSIIDSAFVAISETQRASFKGIRFLATVHNGIELDGFRFRQSAGEYVAWLGRLDSTKGLDHAAAACERAGARLRFAGSKRDPAVYELAMALNTRPGFTFEGYADPVHRDELLGNARALLAPMMWDEPFGYVNVEAMACGTPVVAYDRGANRELIEDGVTGFLCPPGDQDALAHAVRKIMSMPDDQYRRMRAASRKRVETKFTIKRVIDDYERLYAQVLEGASSW